MFKAGSRIFIAYEDSDSFSAISKSDVVPLPQIPAGEMETIVFSAFWAEKSWGNAVTSVIRADMIIISLSGRLDLPVPVRRWMESWPNYKQADHTTLAAVFGTEPTVCPMQNVLTSYFRQIAENHGLDFLCRCAGAKNAAINAQPPDRANQMNLRPPEPYQAFNLHAIPSAS